MWQVLKNALKNRPEINLYRLEVSTVSGISDVMFHYKDIPHWVTGFIEMKQMFKGAKTDSWMYDTLSLHDTHLKPEQLKFLSDAPLGFLFLSFPDKSLVLISFIEFSIAVRNWCTWNKLLAMRGFFTTDSCDLKEEKLNLAILSAIEARNAPINCTLFPIPLFP